METNATNRKKGSLVPETDPPFGQDAQGHTTGAGIKADEESDNGFIDGRGTGPQEEYDPEEAKENS